MFVTRWRLEPKSGNNAQKQKNGEVIEPKKPIVFYIDPATPVKWRKYIKQGVDDWQSAFEKAGWENAIRGEYWDKEDSTMSSGRRSFFCNSLFCVRYSECLWT